MARKWRPPRYCVATKTNLFLLGRFKSALSRRRIDGEHTENLLALSGRPTVDHNYWIKDSFFVLKKSPSLIRRSGKS